MAAKNQQPNNAKDAAASLLEKLLALDPAKRLSATEVSVQANHPNDQLN